MLLGVLGDTLLSTCTMCLCVVCVVCYYSKVNTLSHGFVFGFVWTPTVVYRCSLGGGRNMHFSISVASGYNEVASSDMYVTHI